MSTLGSVPGRTGQLNKYKQLNRICDRIYVNKQIFTLYEVHHTAEMKESKESKRTVRKVDALWEKKRLNK